MMKNTIDYFLADQIKINDRIYDRTEYKKIAADHGCQLRFPPTLLSSDMVIDLDGVLINDEIRCGSLQIEITDGLISSLSLSEISEKPVSVTEKSDKLVIPILSTPLQESDTYVFDTGHWILFSRLRGEELWHMEFEWH